MRRGWVRPVIVLLLVAAGIIAARSLGLGDLIRLENVARLKQRIEGYGALAPAVYIAGYILAVVFFVPALPITVLGGVAFGLYPQQRTVFVADAELLGPRFELVNLVVVDPGVAQRYSTSDGGNGRLGVPALAAVRLHPRRHPKMGQADRKTALARSLRLLQT